MEQMYIVGKNTSSIREKPLKTLAFLWDRHSMVLLGFPCVLVNILVLCKKVVNVFVSLKYAFLPISLFEYRNSSI